MPEATMQALEANATEAVTRQAAEATSALAESAALNATTIDEPVSRAVQAAQNASQAVGEAAQGAAGQFTRDPSATGQLLDGGQSLLGTALVTGAYLCLILGALFVAVWLLRRYGPSGIARPKGRDNPTLIGRLPLGPKQSVCVVRVHDRNLILGVTEERINLLGESQIPAGQCYDEEDEDAFTRFAEELAEKRQSAADED